MSIYGHDVDGDPKCLVVVLMILFSDIRSSKFCLVACGNGWASTRMAHAVTNGCVPVIITPNLTNAFERGDLLPYDDFAVRLQREQVPDLPRILRSATHIHFRIQISPLREGLRAVVHAM